jgi:predicted dehydrogenase
MDSRFELVAGCFSRNHKVNQDTATAYGVQQGRAYRSAEQLLERENKNIDAVIIATPMGDHYRFIVLALHYGLKVITDKPYVSTIADSYSLISRPLNQQASIFCIFNYTGYPMVREMRELIRRGVMGKIFRVMIEMPQDSYIRLRNMGKVGTIQGWRLSDGDIPCLTLDLFVHIHSLVKFLCNERVVQVNAHSRSVTQVSPNLVDEVDAHIHLDNDVFVNAWYGKASLGYRNGLRVRVFGTEGGCEWIQSDPEALVLVDSFGRKTVNDRLTPGTVEASKERYQRFKVGHPAGFIEAFANYYYDIADSITLGYASDYAMPIDVAHEGILVSHALHHGSFIDNITSKVFDDAKRVLGETGWTANGERRRTHENV